MALESQAKDSLKQKLLDKGCYSLALLLNKSKTSTFWPSPFQKGVRTDNKKLRKAQAMQSFTVRDH